MNPKSLESDNYLNHNFDAEEDSVLQIEDENSYGNLDQHMLGQSLHSKKSRKMTHQPLIKNQSIRTNGELPQSINNDSGILDRTPDLD